MKTHSYDVQKEMGARGRREARQGREPARVRRATLQTPVVHHGTARHGAELLWPVALGTLAYYLGLY